MSVRLAMKQSLSDVCDETDQSTPKKAAKSGSKEGSSRSDSPPSSPNSAGENAQANPEHQNQMSDSTLLDDEIDKNSTEIASRRRRKTSRPDQGLDFMCQGKEEKQLYAALRASLAPNSDLSSTEEQKDAGQRDRHSRLRERPPPRVQPSRHEKTQSLTKQAKSKSQPQPQSQPQSRSRPKAKPKAKALAAFEFAVREAVTTNTNKAGGTQVFRELVAKAR
jgi:hypothetical protein